MKKGRPANEWEKESSGKKGGEENGIHLPRVAEKSRGKGGR